MSDVTTPKQRIVFVVLAQLVAVAAAALMAIIGFRIFSDPLGMLGLFVVAGLYFAGLFAAFVAFLFAKSGPSKGLKWWGVGFLAIYGIPGPLAVLFVVMSMAVWSTP